MLVTIAWGVWAVLSKVASGYNNPIIIMMGAKIGYLIFLVPLLLALVKKEGLMENINFSVNALWPIAAIGLIGVLGEWTFYNALERGPSIPVIALSALYPIVSTFLLFGLFGERISGNQIVGLVILCIGMVIFLWGKEKEPDFHQVAKNEHPQIAEETTAP